MPQAKTDIQPLISQMKPKNRTPGTSASAKRNTLHKLQLTPTAANSVPIAEQELMATLYIATNVERSYLKYNHQPRPKGRGLDINPIRVDNTSGA